MDDAMANTILNELREFRAENNKRWEENTNILSQMNNRIVALEEGRKKEVPAPRSEWRD